jgi:16S rRNA (cytosine967-C5)-methyltransferase
MSYDYRRIENAFQLLTQYSGDIPLDNFLRSTFKLNKNWGSKDRKAYREICFRFFRFYDRTALTKDQIGDVNASLSSTESLISEYNPYKNLKLKTTIGTDDLGRWFQSRPPVFVTGNGKNIEILKEELNKNDIDFIDHGIFIESPNQLSETHYPVLKNLQIMDRGSLEACMNLTISSEDTVWDACAGAGGKTFAIGRLYSPEKIISSDVRKKSLSNLQKRSQVLNQFALTKVIDASSEMPEVSPSVILIDAPCSGSGTWRRNPDRAFYFSQSDLDKYVSKQEAILSNIAKHAKPATQIIYVTCSVFERENMDQVTFAKNLGLELMQSEIIGGAEINSDYLFRAVFKKS